ncbi:MAG: hypothetical protein AB7I36_07510 [Rhodospirillaceae bacterium]
MLFFEDIKEKIERARAAGLHAVRVTCTHDVIAALEPYLPHLKLRGYVRF